MTFVDIDVGRMAALDPLQHGAKQLPMQAGLLTGRDRSLVGFQQAGHGNIVVRRRRPGRQGSSGNKPSENESLKSLDGVTHTRNDCVGLRDSRAVWH
jgi:hypothetical protein